MSSFNPNWNSHPSKTVLDCFNKKAISTSNFIDNSVIDSFYLKEFFDSKIGINQQLAVELSKNIGGSVFFWLTRQENYNEQESLLLNDWVKKLPLKYMLERGMIKGKREIIQNCMNFFGISNYSEWVSSYNQIFSNVAFRKSKKIEENKFSTALWLKYGEKIALKNTCNVWDEDVFIEKLYDIKKLTRKKNPVDFLPILKEECSKCGVVLVMAPTPKGCTASGATKWLTNDKAMLLLSFKYLSDDQFWFSFFHEAGHLVLHKKNKPHIEFNSFKGTDIIEKEANYFAQAILLDELSFQQLPSLPRNKRAIINFANKNNISPGMVIGQLQHKGIIPFNYLNSYKRRYDKSVLRQLEDRL